MRRGSGRNWLAGALLLIGCKPGSPETPGRGPDAPQISSSPTTNDSPAAPPEWQIVPGRVGSITLQTSEADLRQHFGAKFDTARIQLGEGETAPGAVLYPDDSLRRAEVIWQDTVKRRRPARIVLRGSRSQWQLGRGISLGTSLQELERLNGGPFVLAGFGWDYAGVIVDWKGGALDTALAGIKLYLDPGPAQHQSAAYSQVLGDRDYSSSLPAMQQLSPKVAQIFVDFDAP